MVNNNNIKNVNQNDNKTLMDAPVPSPVTSVAPVTTDAAVTSEQVTTTTTTTTTAAAVSSECVLSNGEPAAAPVYTQSHNGSIPHSQQKPPSIAGTVKPPSLSQHGGQPPSLTQGQKPPSLTQGQKPPSIPGSKQGSFINQQQQQPFQPTLATLPQLPEPLIPMSHPIDTKQEIVENYLNSLPPVTQGGLNGINGGR